MKVAIISSALIAAHPLHRFDAAYWVPVLEECRKQGINPSDVERVLRVSRTYEALHRKATAPRLGDLVQQAVKFTEDKS